ncbi:serine/threonine-protein kinase [Actinoallomurus oryzae]|uniref:serine/threonine-protein kinase n=1 Tax=Actinoallomurus oryzae TaxID=502180 RepID=UPI0031E74B89
MELLQATDPVEIGGYELVGRLGCGGMGVVYLASDRRGSLVAVKAAYKDATDQERRRLRAEAACLRRVPSAYTARLLDDGTDQMPPYIVTEYVQGRSLEDVVENDGPLPSVQLRALAVGVARALAAVHHVGLIHRDLKPANVLLPPSGLRLIDFGIARQIPASGGMTSSGVVMGSPGWISPERLTEGPATPGADVFGWGCLLAYAGTGRNPFGQGDFEAVAQRTIHEPPDLDGLEPSLRRAVEAALAKDPAERPSARELSAWLSPGVRPVAEADADPEAPAGPAASTGREVPVVPEGRVVSEGRVESPDREPRRPRHSQRASATRRRVRAFAGASVVLAVAAAVTAVLAARTDWLVGRKPGAAAAPPTRSATPYGPVSPWPRGSAGGDSRSTETPRGATAVPSPPRRPSGSPTGHDGRQRPDTDADQGPAGTAGRTVTRATSTPPTSVIDKLLPPN